MKRRTAIAIWTATAAAAVTAGTATVAMANDDAGSPGHVLSRQDVANKLKDAGGTAQPTSGPQPTGDGPRPTAGAPKPTGGTNWTANPGDFTTIATPGGTVSIACHGASGEAEARTNPAVGWHLIMPPRGSITNNKGIVYGNDAGRTVTTDWTCDANSVPHTTVVDSAK